MNETEIDETTITTKEAPPTRARPDPRTPVATSYIMLVIAALALSSFTPPPSVRPIVTQPRGKLVTVAVTPPVPAPLPVGLILAPSIGGAAGAAVAQILPLSVGLPLAGAVLPFVMMSSLPCVVTFWQNILFKFASSLLRLTAFLDSVRYQMHCELMATKDAFGLSSSQKRQLASVWPSMSLASVAPPHPPRNPGTKKRTVPKYAHEGKYINLSPAQIYLENMKRQNGLATKAKQSSTIAVKIIEDDTEVLPNKKAPVSA